MKPIGIMTGIRYSWKVLDVVKTLDKHDVKKIEIWGHPGHADLTNQSLIDKLALYQWDHDIDFVAAHPPGAGSWDLATPDIKKRKNAVNKIAEVIRNLPRLGISRVIVHPGGRRPDGDNGALKKVLKASADSFSRLLEVGSRYKVRLCVENTLPHHVGGRLDELIWLDQHTDGEFNVTLDTSHANLSKAPIEEFIDTFGSRIIHTHLSDNFGSHDDHFPPGEGAINFPEILKKLDRQANLEYWMMEVLHAPGVTELEPLIKRAVKGLSEQLDSCDKLEY